ncbi:MAG TPA: hypothetical protein PK264_06475 [Hyphomicrobiaceae bacterium]|nr:hypothetical protein [Hyphomicrobiaceae bacterium]
MRRLVALVGALALAVTVALGLGSASAQEPIKQIKLTEKQVLGFIASQKEMMAIQVKLQASPADKPDPKILAEFEAASKKHGFASFAEFQDVTANISIIMAGFDPATGKFTDPLEMIKAEIAGITADKNIPDKERKQMLDELNEALKITEPLKFPENIEIVKKFREKIEASMQQ